MTGRTGSVATSETSAANIHLSSPISLRPHPPACPPWGRQSVTKGWQKRGRVGKQRRCDEAEAPPVWSEPGWRGCAVTGMTCLTTVQNDCPLMSFTLLWLSQSDWLVTALSVSVFVISPLVWIRKPVLDRSFNYAPRHFISDGAELLSS